MFHPHPANQPTNEVHEVAWGSGINVVTKSETRTKYGSTAYRLFKTQLKSEREMSDPNNIVESTFSKECSQLWKGMTSAERQPYIDLAKEIKDPNAPRKPMTAYLFFSEECRPIVTYKNQHLSAVEVSKLVGQLWRSLGDDQKTKYYEMNAKEWIRYKKKLEEFKQPSKRCRVEEPSSSSTRDNFQEIGTTDPLQMFHPTSINQPTNENQSEASGSGVTVMSKAATESPMTTHGNAPTAYGVFKTNLQSERQEAGNFVVTEFSKECSQLWEECEDYNNSVSKSHCVQDPSSSSSKSSFHVTEQLPEFQWQSTMNDQMQNIIFNYDGPTNIQNDTTGAFDLIFPDISFNYGQ